MVSYASSILEGDQKTAVLAVGTLLSGIPLFSTLLNKGGVMRLGADADLDIEKLTVADNLRAADELRFDKLGILRFRGCIQYRRWLLGSFRKDAKRAVANASPELAGLLLGVRLCIWNGQRIGLKLFLYSVDPDDRFDAFIA
jgi:hypothetical protein